MWPAERQTDPRVRPSQHHAGTGCGLVRSLKSGCANRISSSSPRQLIAGGHDAAPQWNTRRPIAALLEAQLTRKSLEQCRNIYGRKIGQRIRCRTRQNNPIAMAQGAASVDDVWHIALPLGRLWPHERSRARARTLEGSCLSRRTAPMEYFRTGPTPCVNNSQPSSSSMGEPQLPICTNSQGYAGRRNDRLRRVGSAATGRSRLGAACSPLFR